MQKICKEVNAPEPEIDAQEKYFYVTFKPSYEYLDFVSMKISDKRLVEGLVENQRKILLLINENPYISKREMSERIGISTTAIDKNITSLKKKGLLKRIGPAKGGYWEIVEVIEE